MQKHEVLVTFKALQKSCEKHNSQILPKTLQVIAQAMEFQMTEGVKKIGFALLDILGLPTFDAHVVSVYKMMPLAPSIQLACEPSEWSVPTLSALGLGHLISKIHSDRPKPTI